MICGYILKCCVRSVKTGCRCVYVKAWGDSPSAWSADNLMEATNILAGLSAEDYAGMIINDIEVLSALSGSELFSTNQVRIAADYCCRV